MPALKNSKYEKFAQEMAGGSKLVPAYVNAGFKDGPGAKPSACVLRTRPEIAARILELSEQAAEKVGITKARVLAELAKIGFSDIRQMFDANGNITRIPDLGDDAAGALASVEVVTRRPQGGDKDEVEYVHKFKLHDKRAALVDIGKELGMFKQQVEHSGPEGGPIEMNDMDLARLLAFQLTKAAKTAD